MAWNCSYIANADELHFGTLSTPFRAQESGTELPALSMQDRDMLARYLSLPVEARKTACDVVAALGVAASVKGRGRGVSVAHRLRPAL